MVGQYDPNEGVLAGGGQTGFQEYQGSLREELVDGELRYFRTYVGPSTTRREFLVRMFGLSYVTYSSGVPLCKRKCGFPTHYPMPGFACAGNLLGAEVVMMPYAFRITPLEDEYANTIDSENGLGINNLPQQACLVLAEIEYRQGLLAWPAELHDQTYSEDPPGAETAFGDVPVIEEPRYFWYKADPSLELRELNNAKFGIWSIGGTVTPASVAGANTNNQIDPDDLKAVAAINVNEFTISVFNCPRIDYSAINQGHGKVNKYVWFGYPRHGVLFSDYEVKTRTTVVGTLQYDIDFTFIAKTVPNRAEEPGMVTPTGSDFVYPNVGVGSPGGRVGVFNRNYWNYPITGTQQYWWPYIDIEKAKHAAAGVEADTNFCLYQEHNFQSLFAATTIADCP